MNTFLAFCVVLLLVACQLTEQQTPPKSYAVMMMDPKVKSMWKKNYCSYDTDQIQSFDDLLSQMLKENKDVSMDVLVKCAAESTFYPAVEMQAIPEQKFLCTSPERMFAWCKCFNTFKMLKFPLDKNCKIPVDFGNGTKYKYDAKKGIVVA